MIDVFGTNSGTKRYSFDWFSNSSLGFSPLRTGSRIKMSSGIDRAFGGLSGTIISFVGTGIKSNQSQKYSNPDLRYLTHWEIFFMNS